MLGLPKSTEFDRRIPKQKFYENIDISPALKRVFVEQIKAIYWRNKIASETVNIEQRETVCEIEIFEIKLNATIQPEAVLRQIDRAIPYHIVFLLEFDGQYQAWSAYKEAAASGTNAFKVNKYYHTDWLPPEEIPLKFEGIKTDEVYDNFVRQIRGNSEFGIRDSELPLRELAEQDEKRKKLEKQISALETRIRREKQFNKQVQMNEELKKLKKELASIG